MPVFINATSRDGKTIWLNAAAIVSMEWREDEDGQPYTEVRTTDEDFFAVQEQPQEIIRATKRIIADYICYMK